jgi:hypothetical protein
MADIVGRIKKMLQRANHVNADPNEAAVALAQAQELMFQYQIAESDIEMGEEKRTPEEVVEESVEQGGGGRIESWKSTLAHTVARAFGCKMWSDPYTQRGTVRFHLIGTKSATQTVSYMFSYLHPEIDRMARDAWEAAKKAGETRDSARTFLNSFRMGAVHMIRSRLLEQISAQEAALKVMEKAQEAKASANRGVALALYRGDQERVQEAYEEAAKRLKLRSTGSHRFRHNHNAYERGRSAGSAMQLGGGKALGADKRRIDE